MARPLAWFCGWKNGKSGDLEGVARKDEIEPFKTLLMYCWKETD